MPNASACSAVLRQSKRSSLRPGWRRAGTRNCPPGPLFPDLSCSYQLVFPQLRAQSLVVRADAFQQRMELFAVVHIFEVAEFMEHHVIPQFFRQAHQVQVKIYVLLCRGVYSLPTTSLTDSKSLSTFCITLSMFSNIEFTPASSAPKM